VPSDRTDPQSPIRPLFLLADSQLLFSRDGGTLFLDRVRAEIGAEDPRAAYLGASNGDEPAFYDIFVAAMEGIGLRACRHIRAAPSDDDRAFLEEASVIVLAGGDPERGMRAFQESGLADRIIARYAAGAVIVGVSAGAVQLGQRFPGAGGQWMDGLRLVPMIVAAHEEPEWASLDHGVRKAEGAVRGLGIPAGGGAVVHADLSVEPVRRGLVEIALVEDEIRRALLLPEGDPPASAGSQAV
jgi:peptidase E